MSKNKLYITLILLLTLAFSTKAIANLTLGTTSVTSNGALTLTTNSSTLVLPTTNGTNGQVLTTNGSGVTSWSTVSGGGITNGAGANVVPKSNGTNLVGSRITDDGDTIQLGQSVGTTPIIQISESGTLVLDAGTTGGAMIQIGDAVGGDGTQILVTGPDHTINLNAANGVFINGVKKYVALLTQSGTDAPVATVLENTLGGTVVWTRNGAGSYSGTLSGAFPANKVSIHISGQTQNDETIESRPIAPDSVSVFVSIGDGEIVYCSIEISVYP